MGPSRHRGAVKVAAAAFATLVATCLTACGSSHTASTSSAGTPASTSHASAAQRASVVLDFTPNAIHAGIYEALADGGLRRAGVNLHVIVPGASTDAISLLVERRVNFAILDIHDLAIADAQHQNLVGVMAIVERPLASVIAGPRFSTPRSLAGQTVGVTGDPSDLAVLHSVLLGAGAKADSVKTLTIGYNAVPDLISHRVAAATAFWNDEGVQLSAQTPPFHIFRVEDFGAPPYPELVLTAPASELRSDPSLVRAVVHSLVAGYRAVIADPTAGAHALESQVTGLVPSQVRAQLAGEIPAFTPAGGGAVGALEPALLNRWAVWEQKFGIVKARPDVAMMFTERFLPSEG